MERAPPPLDPFLLSGNFLHDRTEHSHTHGDSGQIENIEAKAHDEVVKLPPREVVIACAMWGASEPELHSVSIAEAVERLAYDLLEETHCGWEDNDGAYGDFIFDAARRSIALDYNERYTASENYAHEF